MQERNSHALVAFDRNCKSINDDKVITEDIVIDASPDIFINILNKVNSNKLDINNSWRL